MLKHLYIQNFALIQELSIDLETGFIVITGETGAGKSILLGALSMLLGQRADTRFVQEGAGKCIIEAVFSGNGNGLEGFFQENDFDYDSDKCIIRREITSSGKSRSYINDTPANLTQLRALGNMLIDIHSQHQNLLLDTADFQLETVDIMAGNENTYTEYKKAYQTYHKLQTEFHKLEAELEVQRKEEDYLRFQWEQLKNISPQQGEDEVLSELQNQLTHAEEIKSGLYQAYSILNNDTDGGAVSQMHTAQQTLQSLTRIFPKAEELTERLNSVYIELNDIAHELEDQAEDIEYDPEKLNEINERLEQLYSLEHKHNVKTSDGLLTVMEEIEGKLDKISDADNILDELKKKSAEAYKKATKWAEALSSSRNHVLKTIEDHVSERLVALGMPHAQFKINMEHGNTLSAHGYDHVVFTFSANKNGTPRPISDVASGGEIARVMLALKALTSGKKNLPTIIFDEIDTGVSGRIADAMAHIMKDMCADGHRQVITITHLPQIAARGTTHLKVYKEDDKERTLSHIIPLNENERVTEIAHMLSGSDLTKAALENAQELLNN